MLQVHVAKINGVLFSGEADSVTVPGTEGQLTVLPHHMQLATNLTAGEVLVKKGGNIVFKHKIEHGVCEVTAKTATILL